MPQNASPGFVHDEVAAQAAHDSQMKWADALIGSTIHDTLEDPLVLNDLSFPECVAEGFPF